MKETSGSVTEERYLKTAVGFTEHFYNFSLKLHIYEDTREDHPTFFL